MNVQVRWLNEVLHYKFSNRITGELLINNNMILYGDPRLDDLKFVIIDFTDTTQVEDFTERDIMQISASDKAAAISNPRIRVAIVVNQESLGTLAAFYTAHSRESPWEIEIFQDLAKAKIWVLSFLPKGYELDLNP